MELRNLQYFVSVYQELSFSKAARKCFVSQPSISAAICQLETELDIQLFIRHAKGASPTQAGKTFYPAAVKVLNEINTMQGLFHECHALVPLRIALMPFLSGERVGLIINELIISLPELDLTVVDWNEEADARIISKSMALQNEAFHNLWVDDYVLAMSINIHLLNKKRLFCRICMGSRLSVVNFATREIAGTMPCENMESYSFPRRQLTPRNMLLTWWPLDWESPSFQVILLTSGQILSFEQLAM